MATEREILVRLNLKADQYNQGLKQAERNTDTFQGKVQQLGKGVKDLESKFGLLQGAIVAAGVAGLAAFGAAAVKAAGEMNGLKLQIAAVVAANSNITDANGKVLQGVEKIRAAQVLTGDLFKQLQADAMKTTATTKELIEQMSVALPAAMANGLNPQQTEKLVVAASNALKVLKIDADQAKSEMRALFSGDINQDADLAKALQLRKSDIEAAKEQGKLYDLLIGKLADFNAAAELQSETFEGAASNVQDFGEKLMQIVGEDALGTLTESANWLVKELMGGSGATTTLHNDMLAMAHDGKQGLYQLVQGAVWLGKQIINVIHIIGVADKALQSWAINVNEAVKSAFLNVGRFVAQVLNKIPGANHTAIGKDIEAFNAGLQNVHFDAQVRRLKVEAYYQGIDPDKMSFYQDAKSGEVGWAPTPERNDASRFHATATPNPHAAEDAKKKADKAKKAADAARRRAEAARKRQERAAAAAERKADAEARKAEREQDRAEQETIQAMDEEFKHNERLNDANKGGHAGSIKNMEAYLARLKALPKDWKGAAKEITKVEHDLAEERAKAHADAEAKKREQTKKTQDAIREAQKAQAAYEQQLLANSAEATQRHAQEDVEDAHHANERKRQDLDRLYQDGKVAVSDYYAQVKALREADLQADTDAKLKEMEAQRKVLANQLSNIQHPKEGLINHAEEAAVQGQIQALDEGMARVRAKHEEGMREIAKDIATEQGDATKEKTRAGLEEALNLVFSGDPIDAIQKSIQQSAVKGLTDALANTALGQKIGGLFGAGGAMGGLAGMLIGGFADLILGSFKDLAHAGEVNSAHLATLKGLDPDRDPIQQVKDEIAAQREAFRKDREKTVKFLGLIPIGHSNGFVTPQEDAELNRIEQQKIAKAQQDAAKAHSDQAAATVEQALHKLDLLKKLGKATTDDLIAELQHALGVADLTEEKALELQAQLADLEEEKRQARDKGFDEQLDDQVTFKEVSLQQAKERVEAEMKLVDQSTDYGHERYRTLRRQAKDLQDQITADQQQADQDRKQAEEEAAKAAEDAANRFKDAWANATDTGSELFRQFAEAAKNQLEFLRKAYDATFSAIERDYKVDVAYGRRSQTEGDYLILGERIKALQREIDQLVGSNTADQSVLSRGNVFSQGAYINGSQFFANTQGDIPSFLAALAAQMSQQGATWVSSGLNGNGWQYQAGQLPGLVNDYRAALERLGDRDPGIAQLRDEIEKLKQQRDVMKAQVEGPAALTIRDLTNELALAKAQAASDPAAITAAKKAQIDAQFADRYRQLYNAGLLSDQFDVEERNKITSALDQLKQLAKQQVDQADANRPTEANPLPVRVVDLPPAFALPSSYYFQAQNQPVINLEPGAIQINGSGLNDRQLQGAVEQALVNAGGTLTRTVNRQNQIGQAIVRLN